MIIDFRQAQTRLPITPFCASEDAVDVSYLHTEPLSKYRRGIFGRADCPDNISRIFSRVMVFAFRLGAMFIPVSHIPSMSIPPQIRGRIVRWFSIVVANFNMLFKFSRYESLSYQAVYPERFFLSARNNKLQFHMSTGHWMRCNNSAYERAFSDSGTTHTAQRANLIVSRLGYGFPKFARVVYISHDRAPCDGGQGRAVFPAPFRSAEYSQLLKEREAA